MNEKLAKNHSQGGKKKGQKDIKGETPVNKPKDNNVFTEKHFNPNQNFSKYLRDHKHKRGIVLTGRVHPGEANSSYVVGKHPYYNHNISNYRRHDKLFVE